MLQRESVVCSLLLCALFMSTLSSRSRSEPCGTEDGLKILQTIRNILLKDEDSNEIMLYTPNEHHFKHCPGFALGCMRKEMKMLLDDWNITKGKPRKILSILDVLKNQTQDQVQAGVETKNQTRNQIQTGTETNNQTRDKALDCDECEKFPTETALDFLTFLISTVEQINYNCANRQRELNTTSPSSQ